MPKFASSASTATLASSRGGRMEFRFGPMLICNLHGDKSCTFFFVLDSLVHLREAALVCIAASLRSGKWLLTL